MGLVSIHQESLHKPGGYTLSASKNKKTAAVLLALSNSRVTEKNNFYGLRGSTFCCHGTSTERSASVNWCKFNLAHKFSLRPLFFAATNRMRRPAHMLIHRSGMRCCAIARPSCLRWPPRRNVHTAAPWSFGTNTKRQKKTSAKRWSNCDSLQSRTNKQGISFEFK